MVKLKISTECILCGACLHVDGSKFKMENGKIIPSGDYTDEVAEELISICPVEAIAEA